MDVAEQNGILTEEEVEQVQAWLDIYQLALKNFDGLFSLLRDKESKLDANERTNQLAKYLNAALACS